MSTPLQTRRLAILAAIESMPPKFNPHRNRLDLVTRAFIEHPTLFVQAIEHGWSDRELFAVDPIRCAPRMDRAGIISGIALSSLIVPKLRRIEARTAVIECGDRGARSTLSQARVPETYLGCCWWFSPELGGRLPEDQTQEIAA